MRSPHLVVMIILVVILIFAAHGAIMSTYRPGWELSAGLVALQHGNGNADLNGALKKSEETANLQFDFDNLAWGLPDIKATSSDVREEVPKMPYTSLEQTFQSYKYIVDYHEYLFDIQVRTIADMVLDNSNPENPQKAFNSGPFSNYWSHETSMPHCYVTNLRGTGGTQIGKAFDGGVYARFSCMPYSLLNYGPVPENYTFTGYWLGIMNAKVQTSSNGVATPNIAISYPGWVRNIESDGSQLNMFQDDGTFTKAYAEVPWDVTKVLDPDIKSAVVIYVPFSLMAGAWEKYDDGYDLWEGAIVEAKPVDYYLTYTIRMETLVVKEYTYREPSISPNPSPIKAPSDYVPYTVPTFWDQYGLWIIIAVVILVLLLFFFSWLGIPVLGLLLGIFRFVDCRDLKKFSRSNKIFGVKWK